MAQYKVKAGYTWFGAEGDCIVGGTKQAEERFLSEEEIKGQEHKVNPVGSEKKPEAPKPIEQPKPEPVKATTITEPPKHRAMPSPAEKPSKVKAKKGK